MSPSLVDGEIRWNPQRWRTRASSPWHTFLDRELASLVELHGIQLRIRNRTAHSTHHNTDFELVLRVRYFADSNPELTFLVTDRPVHAKRIAEVGVAAFANEPCKAYSGLDRREPTVPWDLVSHDLAIQGQQAKRRRIYQKLKVTLGTASVGNPASPAAGAGWQD
jgi:hypothetical protein